MPTKVPVCEQGGQGDEAIVEEACIAMPTCCFHKFCLVPREEAGSQPPHQYNCALQVPSFFIVLLQDNLVWYLPKQWYHPSGTKKERKIKGKKAKELLEKAQSKAGHTNGVTSLLFTLSCDHLYTSSGLQSILEGTQGF